ncbi:MAG: GNAT family N-acetyltransferase [Rhodospirillales bacterium]|nr:GNAT family N-acetyltransferase [Rhodospirillales bacterium]
MAGSQDPSSGVVPRWRAMAPGDLDYVLDLAGRLYPNHPESRSSFEAKLRAAPDACFVAETDGVPVGYCVALWATCGRPPKLDEASYTAKAPVGLHLHDIALEPSARGQGAVAAGLVRLARLAGSSTLSLVAVEGTQALWRRHGFVEAAVDEAVRTTYGQHAVYMVLAR